MGRVIWSAGLIDPITDPFGIVPVSTGRCNNKMFNGFTVGFEVTIPEHVV
jgi:hypothetical protein